MLADLVNGSFEMLGSIAIFGHARRAWIDKSIQGAAWQSTLFFAAWGLWNLYYYPHLDQWASFAGGVLIVIANAVWLALMLKYRK